MINFGNKQLCEYCLNEISAEPCRYCGYEKHTFQKELATLPPGSILMGKYIVGKVMGKGGFGITYLAYDITNNRKVALKEYYPISYSARTDDGCTVAVSRAEDSTLYYNGMKKFYDEASLVSKFNGNPNIVSVHEFFYENGTAYFVMELLMGCSLKSYIEKHGSLTPEQALYVADRVSNALLVAHSANTLHRDIAPDNIMICTNGDVKLIDFGAARQVSAEDQKSLSVILKQGFAPLEQYQKHGNQGPWTDLYSLGATLYYAVTKTCIDDPMTRLDGDDEFQSNPHNVEPQLWDIIKRATNLKIEDRYRDAVEFRADLNKIVYKAQEIKADAVESESSPKPAMSTSGVPQSSQPVNTGMPQPMNTGIPQPMNTGMPQPMNTGMPQPMNTGIPRPVNTGIPQPVNTGIPQPVNTGVPRPVNTGMPQQMNTGVPRPINTGIPQPMNTGVPQPVNTGIPQPVNTGMPRTGQPMNTGVPQTPQPNAGYPGMPQQNRAGAPGTTQTNYNSYTPSGQYPPSPPNKKSSGKGKIFGIIGGIVGLVAIIAIVVAVSSSSTSKPPVSDDDPPSSGGTTTTTTTTAAQPSAPSTVSIGGVSYSVNETTITLSDKGLYDNDIKDLQYFKDLEWLDIDNNNLTDLSVLSSLTNLKHVYFQGNNVSSLDFAKGLTKLEEINCYGNNISDLTPISSLTNLTEFWGGNNPITNIEPLRNLTNMEYLSLKNTSFGGDISPLSRMKELVQIDLYNCGVTDISPLSGCTWLTSIDFSKNNIYDISPLEDCYEIWKLIMTDNYIDTFEQLEVFNSSLLYLSYAEDGILDIQGIGWYYSTYDYALEDKQLLLDGLKAKGYSTDQFEFWATWHDSDDQEVNGLVQ